MVNATSRCKSWLLTGLSLTAFVFRVAPPAFSQQSDKPFVALTECWRNTTISLDPVRPAYDENHIYLAETGGRITAISASTGKLVWSTELGGDIRSNVVVLGPSVYLVAGPGANGRPRGPGSLRVLSAATGVPGVDAPLPGDKARLFSIAARIVVLTSGGMIAAFDQGGRKLAWQRTIPQASIESAVALNEDLVIATDEPKVHLISAATGADVSVIPVSHQIAALGVLDDDIVWGDERGQIVRYDLAKNSVYWRFKNGARVSGFVTTDDGIAAASLDNFTYLISSYYGSVRWKKRLPGRVENITKFGKSLIVAQTIGEPTATLIDVDDGKMVGQVSIGQDSFIMAPLDVGDRLIFFTNHMVIAESDGPCAAK